MGQSRCISAFLEILAAPEILSLRGSLSSHLFVYLFRVSVTNGRDNSTGLSRAFQKCSILPLLVFFPPLPSYFPFLPLPAGGVIQYQLRLNPAKLTQFVLLLLAGQLSAEKSEYSDRLAALNWDDHWNTLGCGWVVAYKPTQGRGGGGSLGSEWRSRGGVEFNCGLRGCECNREIP